MKKKENRGKEKKINKFRNIAFEQKSFFSFVVVVVSVDVGVTWR
jgi:hypothetical protein